MMEKICKKCNCSKSVECFSIRKDSEDSRHNICKSCKASHNKNRRLTLDGHLASLSAGRKSWEKHKKIYNEKRRISVEYKQKRSQIRKTPEYRIKRNEEYRLNTDKRIRETLRARLRSALKGTKKEASAVRDLGCSIAFLKEHLQSKFQPGMSWDNHGIYGWHIDHIKPLSSFNLNNPEEQKQAVHYTNLQPLWAIDNLIKHNKVI